MGFVKERNRNSTVKLKKCIVPKCHGIITNARWTICCSPRPQCCESHTEYSK